MDEIWKDIKGYEELYQVSSIGRVRSKTRIITFINKYGFKSEYKKPGQILKPNTVSSPHYYAIDLHNNKNVERKYIHRLVAEAFIPNPNNKQVVNHIDYNTHNNNVNNLEWVTTAENVQHSIEHFKKPKNVINSSTGYKYIGTRNGKYRVHIYIGSINFQFDKHFSSLDEAIKARDKVLLEKLNRIA